MLITSIVFTYIHICCLLCSIEMSSRSQDNDEFTREKSERRITENRKPNLAYSAISQSWTVSHSSRWVSRVDVYKHSTTPPPVGLGRWALSDKAGCLILYSRTCVALHMRHHPQQMIMVSARTIQWRYGFFS